MTKITICACASRTFIDHKKVAQLAAIARKAGMEVELVSDLCELCETKDAKVHEIAATSVVACHERAVRSLLAFCGEETDSRQLLNLRTGSVGDILAALGIPQTEATADETAEWQQQLADMPVKQGKDAWYPTLDKDLCAECGKCLEFCPFGVYEMVDDRIRVVNPSHCKNNCPACARTCPAGAIIFPKYDHSPINGGEELQEDAVKLDSKELYAQTLRQRLAARKTSILKD